MLRRMRKDVSPHRIRGKQVSGGAHTFTLPPVRRSESSYRTVLYTNSIRELRDTDPVRGKARGTRTLGHRRTGRIRSITTAELPGERRDSRRLFDRLSG